MNPWQQFLIEQGNGIDSPSASASPAVDLRRLEAGFVAPLTDLGLMVFAGEDAAKFLHSQLTNDVEHLGSTEARLAGYCSPKGRLLATFLVWRSADTVTLQLPREIQAAVQKRLQMFILRAKVKARDATDEYAILGLGGQAAGAALSPWFDTLPAAPYMKIDATAGTLIRVADAFGAPRYEWLAATEQAKAAWPQLLQTLPAIDAAAWRLGDILAGVPQVVQATQEQFVPQMINYEAIGGVNFKKGCYPGQEIVARSQYLGKLKRRMILATVDAGQASAGVELFSSADPEQPCGMVVNAEWCAPGKVALLAEIKTAALDAGTVHLGAADGAPLIVQPLPYPLPDAA